MALRAIEGFESFGASGVTGSTLEDALKAKYSSVNTTAGSPDGELNSGWGSGLAFHCRYGSSSPYNYLDFSLDDQTTWIIGFAVKIPSELERTDELITARKSGYAQWYLKLSENGRLYFESGDTKYGTRVLKPNNWYYIEIKVYIHDSSGTVNVNINGVSDISETSVDTKNYSSSAYADGIRFNLNHSDGMYFDDIYIADSASGVNSFIGPCKVETIRPDGDDTVAWDRSTGVDNYALVDEQAPTTTDYVEGDTVNESDLYTYSALSAITGDIAGIQLNTGVTIDTAGTRQLDDRVYSGTTNSNGAGVAIASTGEEIVTRIIEQDPDTSANWSVSGVNAVKAGVIVGD